MKTQYLLALLVLLLPKQAFKYAACRSLWFHFVWKERHLLAVKGNDVCIQATLLTHPKNLMQKISQAHINDGDWEFQQGGWSH